MENFDFKTSLIAHPNISSVEQIDSHELNERITNLQSKLYRSFLVNAHIANINYPLIISEPKEFPNKLPYVHLANPEKHDFHNHVNYDGDVCYTSKGTGVFVLIDKPQTVLYKALSLAFNVLAESVGRNLSDFVEEFEGYWASLPGCNTARCLFQPTQELRRINVLRDPKEKKKNTIIAFYNESLHRDYGFSKRLQGLQSVKAWYIPLKKNILPPPPDSKTTPGYVRRLLTYITNTNREKLYKKPKKHKKNKQRNARYQAEYLLFSHPRPSGALALYGIIATGYSNLSFFEDNDDNKWKVTPIAIQRHDEDYLINRGGANSSLRDKTVTVFGCGSIGSRIVEQLAQAGVGKIIIVDSDILSEDNLYRHVLGGEAIGLKKADAMAAHIKSRLPFIEIISEPKNREQWLKENRLTKIDLMIDATADFTGIRKMNKTMFISPTKVPIVISWLEACGIGGHSLLIDPGSPGCFECLLEKGVHGPFRKCDFLAPYQNVTKDLTGCGGVFTPFSSLDSVKTAILSTELSLERLIKNQTSRYRFWVGDKTTSEDAGLKTSQWYQMAIDGKGGHVEIGFKRINCPVCQER